MISLPVDKTEGTEKSKAILLENKHQEKDSKEKAEKKEIHSVIDEKAENYAAKGSEAFDAAFAYRRLKKTDRGVQLSMTEERSYRAVVSFENLTLEELKQANFS